MRRAGKLRKTRAAIVVPVDEFRSAPRGIKKFQQANGRLGQSAMPLLLAQACLFVNKPYRVLERLVQKGFQKMTLKAGAGAPLKQGMHLLHLTEALGSRPVAFDTVTFKNQGKTPAVLILESCDRTLHSQGFCYVQLEPGATFSYRRNHPAVIIAVLAIGSGILVFVVVPEVIDALDDLFGRCGIAFHELLPDACCGQCPNGKPCTGNNPVQYGPKFLNLTQPSACGC